MLLFRHEFGHIQLILCVNLTGSPSAQIFDLVKYYYFIILGASVSLSGLDKHLNL